MIVVHLFCRKHEGRTPTIVGYDLSELEHWGVSQAERDALEGRHSIFSPVDQLCTHPPTASPHARQPALTAAADW